MALIQVVAVTQALATYALLGIAFLGWGDAAAWLFRARGDVADSVPLTIWLGWAAALLALQVAHFAVPINSVVAASVLIIGVILAVPRMRQLRVRFSRAVIGTGGCFIIAAIWIASRSMLPPENFDSGLYHLPTIRWINAYHIVPGLGNLHGRFAFNQSFFTYAAAVNAFPFPGTGRGVANSFLLLLLLAQSIELLTQFSRERIAGMGAAGIRTTALVMLPIILYLAVTSNGVASPTPDLAATVIQLALFLILIQNVAAWRSIEGRDTGVTVLAFLAATAITVKLSTLAFSVCVVIVWLIESRHSYADRRRFANRAIRVTPFILILGVWIIRGYMLSGCPVYPSTLGCVSASWAVPLNKVADEAKWVYGWARTPGVNWRLVLGSWNWFGPWLSRATHDIVGILYPLLSSVILIIGAIVVGKLDRARAKESKNVSWVILLPVVAGITFWFLTAPDPRFGRVFFWLMTLAAVSLFISSIERLFDTRLFERAIWATVLVAGAAFLGAVVAKPSRMLAVSGKGWMPVESPLVTFRRTSSGLVVYTPGRDDRCWNAQLPCTPYFNPELRLRRTGLASGFTVAHDRESQNAYEQ